MEQRKVEEIQIQSFEQWLSNIVDTFNYDMAQIIGGVIIGGIPVLDMMLTNFDPAPTQYLKESLNKMIDDINSAFESISDEMRSMDERLKALEGAT